MVAEWDSEWVEFEKTMGEAPSLPEDMKAKQAMVNGLFMMSTERLPPPPGDIITSQSISTRLLHLLRLICKQRTCRFQTARWSEYTNPMAMKVHYHSSSSFMAADGFLVILKLKTVHVE